LSGVIDDIGENDHRWWDSSRRDAFVQSFSPVQAHRLEEMKRQPQTVWRTAYHRTRNGKATWGIRRDGIAGCLRTTGGGSSKQALVVAGGQNVRMRWMTAREYSRLMGAGHYLLHGVQTTKHSSVSATQCSGCSALDRPELLAVSTQTVTSRSISAFSWTPDGSLR
jgi:DNA (cytosine-5)-methyltransferase 1